MMEQQDIIIEATETSSSSSVGVVEPVSAIIRPAVEVIAPLDLEGGYVFHVNTGTGRTLRVQVPQGGVQAGQRFAAWVVDDIERGLQEQSNGTASLRWRDGFFECFKYGPCHPMFCLALWCAPCVLGQVMTRANLSILGNPKLSTASSASTFWTPYRFLFSLTTLYIFIRAVTETVFDYTIDFEDEDEENINNNSTRNDSEDDEDDTYPAWAEAIIFFRFLIFCTFSMFVLILMIKTRLYIRQKDHIPAENCGKMEDCCASFWCPWCTVCHLARHTNDYDRYKARCCTDTGLPADAPMYV